MSRKVLKKTQKIKSNISLSSSTSSLSENEADQKIISHSCFKDLQPLADYAIKNQRTFLIEKGHQSLEIFRCELLKRGWIELFQEHSKAIEKRLSSVSYSKAVRNLPVQKPNESTLDYTTRCELYILSRLIEHRPVHLRISQFSYETAMPNPEIRHLSTIVNRLDMGRFGYMESLACNLQNNLLLSKKNDLMNANFPRTYFNDWFQFDEFIRNFRYTAAVGFLKFCVEKKLNFTSDGEIPYKAFEFAIRMCSELVDNFKKFQTGTEELLSLSSSPLVTDVNECKGFLKYHQLLILGRARIRIEGFQSNAKILKNAEIALDKVKPFWPEFASEGYFNIWILKPADNMNENKIEMSNSLAEITDIIMKKEEGERFMIQKYIEKPLTIHSTKFTFRIFFLVTNITSFEIWIYKKNYGSFSQRPFCLYDYHESIHFTNYSSTESNKDEITTAKTRQFDCQTLQAYLREMRKGEIWAQLIYPAIKQTIIALVLASVESQTKPDNSFQLFAANFLISEDFKPWILEVNRDPAVTLFSDSTKNLIQECVKDAMKVIIEREQYSQATTGDFVKIYTQLDISPISINCSNLTQKIATQLTLKENIGMVKKPNNSKQLRCVPRTRNMLLNF